MLKIEWLTRNDALVSAFACEFLCEKQPINCDLSSLTFLLLSALFGGKSVLHFLWAVWKCLSAFPLLRVVIVDWQIRQMHFEKDCILHGNGMFFDFLLGPAASLIFLSPVFCWYQLKPPARSLSSLVFCSSLGVCTWRRVTRDPYKKRSQTGCPVRDRHIGYPCTRLLETVTVWVIAVLNAVFLWSILLYSFLWF